MFCFSNIVYTIFLRRPKHWLKTLTTEDSSEVIPKLPLFLGLWFYISARKCFLWSIISSSIAFSRTSKDLIPTGYFSPPESSPPLRARIVELRSFGNMCVVVLMFVDFIEESFYDYLFYFTVAFMHKPRYLLTNLYSWLIWCQFNSLCFSENAVPF